MAGVTRFLARRLKLKVNADKSAVDRPAVRAFLGFSFTAEWATKRRIAPQVLARFKARVREMTRCSKSVSLTRLVREISRYPVGWRRLLRLLRDPFGTAPPRPMGQTAAPRHRLAAVEARVHPLRGAAPSRRGQGPRGHDRRQCTRPMEDQQQPRALLRAT